MFAHFRPAAVLLLALTLVTGIAYPLLATVLAQTLCPRQAGGSIIMHDGKAVGSELIGQPFSDPRYFWPRPSAASPPYSGIGGSGSNLAVSNPARTIAARAAATAMQKADPGNQAAIPVDLLTASASGLDPHITPAAAEYQLARVARARGMQEAAVRTLVQRYTEQRDLGLFGENRVNVLKLNLALDGMKP